MTNRTPRYDTDGDDTIEADTNNSKTETQNFVLGSENSISGYDSGLGVKNGNLSITGVQGNNGTSTQSGDGDTKQFTIAHGLGQTPNYAYVFPQTQEASADYWLTWDSTNIYINYSAAPETGTDNLKWNWSAVVNSIVKLANSDGGYFQATATNESIDYNTNGVSVEWDSEHLKDEGYYSHDSANTPGEITFNQAGLYNVSAVLAQESFTNRTNVGIRFEINGSVLDGIGASGYIRSNSGHNNSSSEFQRLVDANAGDVLTVTCRKKGNSNGTVTTVANKSILTIEKKR